jgi:hypothetical protein
MCRGRESPAAAFAQMLHPTDMAASRSAFAGRVRPLAVLT